MVLHEETLNIQLGSAFRRAASWRADNVHAEQTRLLAGNQRCDVLVSSESLPPVAVECEFDRPGSNPVADAEKRLGAVCRRGVAHCAGEAIGHAVAVLYPRGADQWAEDDIADKLDAATDLKYKLVYRASGARASGGGAAEGEASGANAGVAEGEATGSINAVWPSGGWLEGSVSDLCEFISKVAVWEEDIAEVCGSAADWILSAATRVRSKLANNPRDLARVAMEMGSEDDPETGTEIACVVWLDALLMQNRLAETWDDVLPVAECLDKRGRVYARKIKEIWENILENNWESVFRPAVQAWPKAVPVTAMSDPLTVLYKAVGEIEQAKIGETASIGGEVFANVLERGQRKKSAAFYTKSHVAEFLTWLAIHDRKALAENFEDWRAADFACGTGTLLRAAYRRLRQLAKAEKISSEVFHRRMMEEGLCGVDIAPIAVHLTATSLVSMLAGVPYLETNIGMTEIGVFPETAIGSDGKIEQGEPAWIATGSLELINGRDMPLFSTVYSPVTGEKSKNLPLLKAPDSSFDVVLMNPPYSRTRGGQAAFDLSQISDKARPIVQERVRKLAGKTCGNMKAGLGSVFAGIADMKLKDGGRVGLVLPMTISAQASWRDTREMFAREYSDVLVIYFAEGSHGKEKSMSADTSMGEVILTATKGKSGRAGIGYVSLDMPFRSAMEASETARAVWQQTRQAKIGDAGQLLVGGDRAGSWAILPHSHVWGAAGSEGLVGIVATAAEMIEGRLVVASKEICQFPVKPLDEVFDIGPTHHRIGHLAGKEQIGAFKLYPFDTENPHRASHDFALWAADSKAQTTILELPTHYGIQHDKAKTQAIRSTVSNLFYQRNIRWTSQKILAAATEAKCLGGSAWVSLQGEDEAVKFAFAVWANSIFGFVSHWHQTGRQQAGRSRNQIKDTKRILVPDFAAPDLLARAKPHLPKQQHLMTLQLARANQADPDPNRHELNQAAAEILGIPEEHRDFVIADLSERWVKEPSVTG